MTNDMSSSTANSDLPSDPSAVDEALQDQSLLAIAMDAANAGWGSWNWQTEETEWCDRGKRIMGFESDEEAQTVAGWLRRVHPDDRARVEAHAAETARERRDFDTEYRIIHPNGETRWLRGTGRILYDASGTPVRSIGLIFDLTDRKRRDANTAFLAEVTAEFSYISTADEIVQMVGAKMGAYLNLSLCLFAEIDDVLENVTVNHVWHRADVPNVVGVYRVVDFLTDEICQSAQNRETIIIRDTNIDPRTDSAKHADLKIGSFVTVPFHKHGQWKFFLSICSLTPRNWRPDEVQLIQDLSSQVFPRLERARAQAVLRESEQRLSAIFAQAAVGLSEISLDGHFEQVNDALCNLLGRPREELLGMSAAEVTYPDDVSQTLDALAQLMETGGSVSLDKRYLRPDGTIVWANSIITRLTNGQRQPQRFLVVTVDLSDRKQAEMALRREEQRYRYIFESVNVSIWEEDFSAVKTAIARLKAAGIEDFQQYFADHPGFVQEAIQLVRLRNVNQSSLLLFGAQTKAELLNSLDQIFIPETQDAFVGELLAIAAEEPYFAAETTVQTLKGDRIDVWFGITFPDPSDPYDRVLVSLVDITDRKRAEAALRESEERFRTSIENMLDCFAIYRAVRNQQGQIIDFQATYINDAACLDSQFSREDHLQRRLCDLLPAHRETGLFDEYCHVVETGQSLTKDSLVYEDNFGSQHLVRAFDIRVAKFGDGYVATWRDIIDRKRAELEREKLLKREQAAREEAERANRMKDEFLAILSHELRSPLNPILGWAKLLQTRKMDETKTQQGLSTIERNVKLQTQLIDDLLDVAKILRGKLKLEVASVGLASVIQAALEVVRTAAEAKSISLRFEMIDACQVRGDEARLQQIIWNLLSNAIKFTANGGQVEVRLEQVGAWQQGSVAAGERGSVRVFPSTHQPSYPSTHPPIHPSTHSPAYAQLTVTDTGRGIDPDFLPYIFQSFRQADASTTRQYGGLGLGLSIVKHLVDAHGGSITAYSEGEGRGATFTVLLPLSICGVSHSSSNLSSSADLNLTGIKILAADDIEDARELLTTLLEQYGAEVKVVGAGEEVLAHLATFQPDILVCDIGMPNMDGYDLIRRIRALPPEQGGDIPAIALTAYVRDEDAQRALRHGFQKHIAKPLEPERLALAIAELTTHTPST